MSTDVLDPLVQAQALTRSGAPLDVQARAWQRATEADPGRAATWRCWVEVLERGQRPDLVFAVLRRAVQLFASDAWLWAKGATVLQAAGQLEGATEWLTRAVTAAPGQANHHANLAHHLYRCRREADALRCAQTALAIEPAHPLALHTQALVAQRRGEATTAEQGFRRVLDAPAPELRAAAGLALARMLHGQARHDEAWERAATAQALRHALPAARAQDHDWLPRTVSQARGAWSAGVPAPRLPADPLTPVFVVGFIRSGTTLVEQLLAESGLPTSDEAPVLDATIAWLAQRSEAFAQRGQAALPCVERGLLLEARAEYHRQAKLQLGVDGRFVDKLPLNLLYLPLIRALFPGAPVVVVLRDPRDAVASTFFQDLALNPANVHFTELHSLATRCAQVMGLWLQWRQQRLSRTQVLHYEALVAQPERVSQELFAHCRLPWRPQVLRFFERAGQRAIVTPSADAVAAPIHQHATGRWQAYAAQMAPVLPILDPLAAALSR